ncbi:MAG: hypothetical protein HRT69_16715 [Flavobacteriaceae bacterium]|nr:hypothetical protein [Flavobacteriaceae bacterium]
MFGVIFSWNYLTYMGLKKNTGYTYGIIIANLESGKHDYEYSRYQYGVDGVMYYGKQGNHYPKEKMVVIVFDKENPKYSMIAKYPLELMNYQKVKYKIEKEFVSYTWWDYVPVENVSDLWNK